ncbi:hypothetical protein Tco_0514861 [Tanacetum coccineum]
MRTRSSSNLIVESSTILKRRNRRRSKQIVEPEIRTIVETPVVTMADTLSTTTSSQSPSLDVTALTEMVKELVLMNKANQQASVKAVDEICVTCGGPHPYYECLATDSNTFNAYAATGTYNQGGPGYRPQGDPNYRASNQMGPPGFPPSNVQNNQNYNRYNQNQGNYQAPNNQGRGQNFNQGNNNYQAPNFQAPNYQAQVGPSNELTNYMKSNEATLRAMQTQMTNMKTELRNEFKSTIDTRTNKIENQNNQIMNMLTNMQKQNPSGLGSLSSNTVANPRGDSKAITTRSGVSYDGPTIPPTPSPLPKEVERETKVTKDKVQTTSLESTAHVQPPVVQDLIPKPEVAPKPNPKPSIPYPSRLNDQKLCEKASNQMLKFLQIFQRLHFDISFMDALLHMPKFDSTFKSLLSNKEKLFELANTPLNENCSAVLLKQLPEKLGDPGITTSTPDSSPSPTPVKTSDSLLEKFVDELALLDPFPSGIVDTDFDAEEGNFLLENVIKWGNFVTFSNPLFAANDDFTSSNDESLPEEDVQKENFNIYSNPLFEFDEEYISSDVNPLFNKELEDIKSNESYVSNLDEPVLSVTPLFDANEDECFNLGGDIDEINTFIDMDVSTVIEDGYHDSKGDEILLEYLLKKIASMDSSLLFSSGSEDIIFDPDIPIFRFYSLEPVVSHRNGTFKCFNVYLNILNESPI